MRDEPPRNDNQDGEMPDPMWPIIEFDASANIPPEVLAKIPRGGFVPEPMVVHEPIEFDCSKPKSDEDQQ